MVVNGVVFSIEPSGNCCPLTLFSIFIFAGPIFFLSSCLFFCSIKSRFRISNLPKFFATFLTFTTPTTSKQTSRPGLKRDHSPQIRTFHHTLLVFFRSEHFKVHSRYFCVFLYFA